jgi:predicted RNA-binding Zn ribbon-like protein|tara:strand:- start:23 stop:265 length:243 start_codon:yes stop_codon:yes gene_type:complete
MAIRKEILNRLNILVNSSDWGSLLEYLNDQEKINRGMQDTSESIQKLYQSQGSEQLINRLRSLKEIVKNEFISQKQENNR